MSSAFKFTPAGAAIEATKSPDDPDLPAEPEALEEVTTATQDSSATARRRKRGIRAGGRQSTVLSGIQTALNKRRLGE